MRSRNSGLTVPQALALGALQGPAELLPISSSAHISAIPWLLGWSYGELDPELRKSFEVALHAGTALALAIAFRDEPFGERDRRNMLVTGLACVPPALAGYAFERQIERRLGTPATIAAGLLAGSVTMALADRFPERRRRRDAGARDALWLGLAQAAALIPGVSRSGATLSAARMLGFRREDADRLSAQVGLPVLAGASLLKAIRLAERGLEPASAPTLAAGAAASFASTLISVGRRRPRQRLLPYALYRVALATSMLIRLRAGSTAHRPGQAPR